LRNTLRFCEQKVQHLEEAAAPRLAFEIAADARWFFQRPGEADCYISVRNTSTAKTIDDVRVFLEWHSAGQRSKIQTSEKVLRLQFREGSVMNIPPTGLAHFRLCTIFDEPWPAPEKHAYIERIVFAPEVDASRAPKYATGTYEVHVRAEGRDVPPVPAAFILFSHLTTTDLRLDPTKIGADWPSL
jgi:hypothetical protein